MCEVDAVNIVLYRTGGDDSVNASGLGDISTHEPGGPGEEARNIVYATLDICWVDIVIYWCCLCGHNWSCQICGYWV